MPSTAVGSTCEMSSRLPSLLVQDPSPSCRATCVGTPSPEAKIATFSKPASKAPELAISYPSVAKARMKLATVSSRSTSTGQYANVGSEGHHQRATSPAAQATQLYVGSGG